jgi:hypothetical protein
VSLNTGAFYLPLPVDIIIRLCKQVWIFTLINQDLGPKCQTRPDPEHCYTGVILLGAGKGIAFYFDFYASIFFWRRTGTGSL